MSASSPGRGRGRGRAAGASARPAGKSAGRYHHGALREALLGAALQVIAEQDVSAVSLREVARRAGVSQAAPYHHFQDKGALLAAVAEEGFRRMGAAARQAMASPPAGPDEGIARVLGVYVTFASEHPAHFQVMFLPELHAGAYPELERAGEETFALLVDAVGWAAPDARYPPAERAAVTLALAHGFASLAVRKERVWRQAHPEGLAGVVRLAAEMLARAWGASAPSPASPQEPEPPPGAPGRGRKPPRGAPSRRSPRAPAKPGSRRR